MDWFTSVRESVTDFVADVADELDAVAKFVVDEQVESESASDTATTTANSSNDSFVPHTELIYINSLLKNPSHARELFLETQSAMKSAPRLSASQIEHAKSILSASPPLRALRFELCPSAMQDHVFWACYFRITSAELDGAAAKPPSPDLVRETPSRKRSRSDDEEDDVEGAPASLSSLLLSGARFAERVLQDIDSAASSASPVASPPPSSSSKPNVLGGRAKINDTYFDSSDDAAQKEKKRARRDLLISPAAKPCASPHTTGHEKADSASDDGRSLSLSLSLAIQC